MSDSTMIPGTTPAGQAPRGLRFHGDGGHCRLSIWSASGNFMADIRLDVEALSALLDQMLIWVDTQIHAGIEADIDAMVRDGLVEEGLTEDGEPGLRLTPKGRERAAALVREITGKFG